VRSSVTPPFFVHLINEDLEKNQVKCLAAANSFRIFFCGCLGFRTGAEFDTSESLDRSDNRSGPEEKSDLDPDA